MSSEAENQRESFFPLASVVYSIGLAAALFHLYAAQVGTIFGMFQRSIHWMFMSALIFLAFPTGQGWGRRWLDLLFIGLSLLSGCYLLTNYEDIAFRLGSPTLLEIFLGGTTILLVLEATRRAVGWPIVAVAILSIFYAYFGYLIPGIFGHRGYSLTRIISHLYLTTEGIYGVPLGASASFIILFIIFGAFLDKCGATKFFIDLAFTLTGRTMGGPAKTAIVSSGLIAMVSGSAAANVVTTGTITIPLMKRTGYRPFVAGAIEALASSGGQIMPPVMGAGAFIMSELTGIPYVKIMAAAFFPALFFYISLYQMVHYEAGKMGLQPLTEERPPLGKVLKEQGHLFLPILLLVFLMIAGRSPNQSCFLAIVSVVLVSWMRRKTRMGGKKILEAMADGARGTVMIAAATACAGIVIGMITLTGIGLSFSSIIISLSHGYLLLALIFTMVASIILGMGIPTAAAYIIVAILGAPALMRLGVPEIAAHLFVFYFAIISAVTPPVALAAYAGAGIAKAPPMKTALYATLFGLYKFLLPFIFIYNTGLILIGGVKEIGLALIVSLILSFLVAASSVGFYKTRLNPWLRFFFIVPIPLLISPLLWVKALGLAIFSLVFLWARRNQK